MSDFDQTCRYTVKLDPGEFYRWLLGHDVPLYFRARYDTRTLPKPKDRDRTGDLVGLFAPDLDAEVTAAVITEFQTENDAEILDRLNEEIARFRRELRPRGLNIFGGVVNLTGPEQIAEMRMELPGKPEIGSSLRVVMLTLRNEDAGTMLDVIAEQRCSRVLLAWIPLLRNGSEPGTIQRLRQLAETEPDANFRADLGSLAKIWLRLLAEPTRVAWEKGLKGYNMIESPFMQELRQEGRQEGQIEKQKDILLRAIRLRSRTGAPAELVALINGSNDLAELDRWIDAVMVSSSLDEFRTAIGH